MNAVPFAANVHTGLIPSYPSTITVHNSTNQSQAPAFEIYNASDGSRIGSYSGVIPPDGSWIFSESKFAADTGLNVLPGRYHLNFVLPASFPGSVIHTVVTPAQAVRNLTEACGLAEALAAPTLPASTYRYADAELNLPPYYTDTNARASAAATDNTPTNSNPITDAGATLGRVLFYDRRLSANNAVACASCHQQSRGFSDPNQFSRGFNGALGTRHAMGLSNARFYQRGRFFWDERAATLEDQVLAPIQNPAEMGMTLDSLVPKLAGTSFYPDLFKAAFGTPDITSDRISRALAQFVRSLVSYQSKYDAFLASGPGNAGQVLTAQELQGLQLFGGPGANGLGRTFNCARCHQTASQSLDTPQNIGLDPANSGDQGVGRGRFKVPALRNVAVRGRFMHDGRFSSLAEVVEFYNSGIIDSANLSPRLQDNQGNAIRLNMTQTEKDALIAFLNTFTDQTLLSDVRFSNPFSR